MLFLRLDEGVSWKIAVAARAIRLPQDLQIETPYELAQEGFKEPYWISDFAERGRASDKRAVFSADIAMRYTEAERLALEQARITVFYAPGQWWRALGRLHQAAYVLRWLTAMNELALTFPDGVQFRLPQNFSGLSSLKPLPSLLRAVERRRAAKVS